MKILKSVIILIAFVLPTKAQKPIKVEDYNFALTDVEYKGFTVNVPEVFYVDVKKAWVKELESGTKSKVTEARDGEISIFGANMKEISSDPINVYSQLMSADSAIQLSVAIEIGRDQFISEKNKEAYNKSKAYLFSFAKELYTNKVQDDLKEEEKKLQDIERELQKLQNQKKKLRKDIEQYEQGIKDSEEALKILDSDLKLKTNELENLKNTLESETEEVVKADLEDKLEDAQKEKRKILNSIDREKKNISDNKTNIENAKEEIKSNEALQETYPEKIQDQQKVVGYHKNKLSVVEGYQ